MGVAAAVAAHGPLYPAERDTEDDERDKIRDHEGPAAILADLAGKAQEIAESDSAAGNGEDNTDPSTPVFTFLHSGTKSTD